jgi:hypothetical protein
MVATIVFTLGLAKDDEANARVIESTCKALREFNRMVREKEREDS